MIPTHSGRRARGLIEGEGVRCSKTDEDVLIKSGVDVMDIWMGSALCRIAADIRLAWQRPVVKIMRGSDLKIMTPSKWLLMILSQLILICDVKCMGRYLRGQNFLSTTNALVCVSFHLAAKSTKKLSCRSE
jgi:hypothetical protein